MTAPGHTTTTRTVRVGESLAESSAPAALFVGVDIGGSAVKGGLVDPGAGRLAAPRIRLPTPEPATPAALAELVRDLLNRMDLDGLGYAGPIGLAMPSVVRGGIVRTASHIDQSWLGVHAAHHFAGSIGRRVVVVNDADAAGVAEVSVGAGCGHRGVVLLLTVGTGIGSALFVDGNLLPNTELGHLPRDGGPAEQWAAASARKREGLSWAVWAHRLRAYLELVERLLWPDLIIIGGGVSRKADRFLSHLDLSTQVVPALLRNEAGIVGAALLAEREC